MGRRRCQLDQHPHDAVAAEPEPPRPHLIARRGGVVLDELRRARSHDALGVLDDVAFETAGADRAGAGPRFADQHPRTRATVGRPFYTHDRHQGAPFVPDVRRIERFD
jgi:hypothetical protein